MSPSVALDQGLADEWDALADEVGASPFHRPGWYRCWWAAFGSGRLEILTVRRDGRLVAVLPVALRQGLVRSPTNYETFEYGPVALDDDARNTLTAELTHRSARSGANLRYLRPPFAERLTQEVRARRGGVVERVHQRSPYIDIDRPWEEYATRLEKRWVRQLGKRRGRLDARGGLTLDVLDARDPRVDLVALLDEGFGLEAAGWKGEAGTAVLSSPVTTRFYRELGAWAADRGWLRLAFLRVAGKPVAFDFNLEADGIHYFVKTGFDPAYREDAPGLVLRHDMIKRAFDEGLRRYELLGGDEPWKRTWTDDLHDAVHVLAFPQRGVGAAAAAGARRAIPLARQARDRMRERGTASS